MFTSLLYEIVLIFTGIVYLPFFLYQILFKGKYRNSALNKMGIGFPRIDKGNRPLIWIHAVSLGETKAVSSLAKSIKSCFDNPILIFSSTTETGHVEACRSIAADYHVYLPFDFGWIIRPIVKKVSPNLVVICESDYWYNFLSASKDCGALVALVNGKVSNKSLERFQYFNLLSSKLFSKIDLFCVQSYTYKDRFQKLGIDESKISVTGNMKFDGDYSKLTNLELESWRKELSLKEQDLILVIGSSHSPEEELFLGVLKNVWEKIPNLKVLIVPRHPERFNEVAGVLQKNQIHFRRLSQSSSLNADNEASVILIDAMGLLRKCYQLADVAIVAGSFTPKVGGHNILEPCWYGVPTIFGPVMYGQPDMVDLVLEYNAGRQVSLEELEKTLVDLLQDESVRKILGEGGLRLSCALYGASDRTVALIKDHLILRKDLCVKK